MSEQPNQAVRNERDRFDSKKAPFDHELDIRALVIAAVIGAVISALSFVTMWWLFLALKGWEESKDPSPSVFQEQIQNYKPPAPNLQEFPPTNDIEAFHEWENEMLHNYGMVDEEGGVARIPIERAMELALERGFPTRAGAELEAPSDQVEVPGAMTVDGEGAEGEAVEPTTADEAAPEASDGSGHGAV